MTKLNLPLKIESNDTGPVLYNDFYVVIDNEGNEAFRAFIDGDVGCVGTIQKLQQIVHAVNQTAPGFLPVPIAPPQVMTNADREVIDAMIKSGGSFVAILGVLCQRADAANFGILKAAFPDYWKSYQKIVANKRLIGEHDHD